MFIAALFIISTKCKYPPNDEWINKMWYTYTMEYYLAIKRDEIWGYGNVLKLIKVRVAQLH